MDHPPKCENYILMEISLNLPQKCGKGGQGLVGRRRPGRVYGEPEERRRPRQGLHGQAEGQTGRAEGGGAARGQAGRDHQADADAGGEEE